MRLVFLAILCVQGVFLYAEKPTHLKALVVFDGSRSRLQKYYSLDSKKMETNLLGIASQTGLLPEIQVAKIGDLTMSTVKTWIKAISPHDVAVFYYVGQESKPRNGKWPLLSFQGLSRRTCISQGYLTKLIQQKNPHLALILLDCYSKVIRGPTKSFKFAHTVPLQRISTDPDLLGLFLESSGVISACSARPGKPSFGIYRDRPIGGLFTSMVQNSLRDGCDTGTSFWSDLKDDITSRCLYLSKKSQKPLIYKDIRNPFVGEPVPKYRSTTQN